MSTICEVNECNKSKRKGSHLCSMHAERLRKYNDVNVGAFKPRGSCSVDGCDNPHYGKSYCVRHYKRWRKYGNPEAGGIRKGSAKEFLDETLILKTDECVMYPYHRNKSGYGWVNISGQTMGAHVYIAKKYIGERPSKKHEVCHTCGNGHLGCVNPKHLYWGTRYDNVRDAMKHGTAYTPPPRYGENHHNFKCTVEMKDKVMNMLIEGQTQTDIARVLNVSQSTVSRIKNSYQSS